MGTRQLGKHPTYNILSCAALLLLEQKTTHDQGLEYQFWDGREFRHLAQHICIANNNKNNNNNILSQFHYFAQ